MSRNRMLVLTLMLVALACAAPEASRDEPTGGKQVLVAKPRPDSLFSPAVRAGGVVFLSGQLGRDPATGELAPGGIQAETRQALENIRGVLEQAGLGLADVVKCTVFLADVEDYAPMNEIYRTFFPDAPPARSALAAGGLVRGARVEIECIAAAR